MKMTKTDPFRFKQFEVFHHLCAHKVGFDGVLLGAWTNPINRNSILDAGCGSGLLSLMIAQKSPQANIIALEIDHTSAQQATENIQRSSFSNRISILNEDIRTYKNEKGFDLIICNPPFYIENVLAPDQRRASARQINKDELDQLLGSMIHFLNSKGKISLIVPHSLFHSINTIFLEENICLSRKTNVFTKGEEPHRVLLEYSKESEKLTINDLFVYDSFPNYSEEYRKLTQEFYLEF